MTRASLRFILPAVLLVACSERPTGPPDLTSGDAAVYANKDAGTAAELASVIWEARAGDVVKARSFTPIVASRAYGLVALAQYAGVVAVDGRRGGADAKWSKGFHAGPDMRRGAVAGASVEVLSYIAPTLETATRGLLAADAAALSGPAREAFLEGAKTGADQGKAIVAWGKSDGLTNPDNTPKVWDGIIASGPEIWIPETSPPAGFQFPTMQPYYLKKQSQFRPGKPTEHLTTASPEAMEVVAFVNESDPLKKHVQDSIAIFWNLSPPSVTPLGYWDQQAAKYIKEAGLDERDATYVFALVNTAAMDAVIGCWEAKFHYLVRRPWAVDPSLTPAKLILGKPNHPSYPSGHSCVSSAAATVLKHFFPHKKKVLDAQVEQAGMSRIYAGIHYRMDIEAGQALGRSTARWALRYDRKHGLLNAVMPASAVGDHDNRP